MRFLRSGPFAFWLLFTLIGGGLVVGGVLLGRDGPVQAGPQYQVDRFELSELVPVVLAGAQSGHARVPAELVAQRCEENSRQLAEDGRDDAADAYAEIARWARSFDDAQPVSEQLWRAEVLAQAISRASLGEWEVIDPGAKDGYPAPTTPTTVMPAADRVQTIPMP